MTAVADISNFVVATRGRRRIRKSNDSYSFRVAIGRAFLLLLVVGGTTTSAGSHYTEENRSLQWWTLTHTTPTQMPSFHPTVTPMPTNSAAPSFPPSTSLAPSTSKSPTGQPTQIPVSSSPSDPPSKNPVSISSDTPSHNPTGEPTGNPSWEPSTKASAQHSDSPTKSPVPSAFPTSSPSMKPILLPSLSPSVKPTHSPTFPSTNTPSVAQTLSPTKDSAIGALTTIPDSSPTTTRATDDDGIPPVPPDDDFWNDDFFDTVPLDELTDMPSIPIGGRLSIAPTRFFNTNQTPSQNSLTSQPNVRPTIPPSPKPVPNPTRNPTVKPTMKPTMPPTKLPTKNPTKSPTKSPTKKPTPAPSPKPTGAPSPSPTRKPSPAPTVKATPLPTRTPTEDPSLSPSLRPTKSPTKSPTVKPTLEPSRAPTVKPTPDPTPSGTFEPTLNPTRGPTQSPTVSLKPSPRPITPAPTDSPADRPTAQPTSAGPTVTPTAAPTLPMQSDFVLGVMRLFPYVSQDKLVGQPAIAWEKVTSEHIKNYILKVEPELFDLEVGANMVNQGISPYQGRGRELQIGVEQSLIIDFDVLLSYRSDKTNHDMSSLVFSAWEDAEDRAEFVMALQDRAEAAFGDVEDVQVEVDGYVPPPPNDDDNEQSNVAVIAGASVGGAALLLLFGFLMMRKRGDSLDENNNQDSKITPETAQMIAMTTEIQVELQDDVSTLGDPMFAPGGMLMGGLDKDEVTASVGDDYDYARQYRHARAMEEGTPNRSRLLSEEFTKSSSANSTTMSKLGRMGESLFADDASFEEQFAEPEERFDVVAPAGKLGMVIDTPNGGMPVVHAIKDTSVLANQVRVGDRLLSVDGEDCTAMTAMQVSKLISLKSEKPARVLVFARSRAHATEQ